MSEVTYAIGVLKDQDSSHSRNPDSNQCNPRRGIEISCGSFKIPISLKFSFLLYWCNPILCPSTTLTLILNEKLARNHYLLAKCWKNCKDMSLDLKILFHSCFRIRLTRLDNLLKPLFCIIIRCVLVPQQVVVSSG